MCKWERTKKIQEVSRVQYAATNRKEQIIIIYRSGYILLFKPATNPEGAMAISIVTL